MPEVDKQETVEQIAERIANTFRKQLGFRLNDVLDLDAAILSALRSRDDRAIRLIDEHQALDVCLGNCWEMIRKAIREGR